MSKPKIGRPALKPEAKHSQRIFVPVTDAQAELLRAWAEREEKPMTVLIRDLILRAARRSAR